MRVHNQQCPHCGLWSIVPKRKTGESILTFEVTSTSSLLFVQVTCTMCGWEGEEIYGCQFKKVQTTKSPAPVFDASLLIPVESSVIEKIGFDPETEVLAIKFYSGSTIYQYEGCTAVLFVNFLNSNSKGRFYSDKIRGKYIRIDK